MQRIASLPNFLNARKPAAAQPPAKSLYKASQKSFKAQNKQAVAAAGYILAALNIACLLWYLFGVNGYAASGYEINRLQQRVNALDAANTQLNLQYAENSSIVSSGGNFADAQFVPISSVRYVAVNQLNQFSKR